jgi:UPF0755 protein
MRKFKAVFGLFFISILMFSGFCYNYIFIQPISVSSNDTIVKVKAGQDFNNIVFSISKVAKVSYPSLISLYAQLSGVSRAVHVGEYEIENNSTWYDILQKFRNGNVKQRYFTIVEGWNKYTLFQALLLEHNLEKKLPYNNIDDFIKSAPKTNGFVEGAYFPDTYAYSYPETDIDVLRRASDAMRKAIVISRKNCKQSIEVKDQMITASLLEKEAVNYDEMGLIVGVINNRFKKNMKLEIDASVRYGVKNFTRPIYMSELKDKNKYNLYVYKGLPPSPIAMPSLPALSAVCNPIESDYLYYVLKSKDKHHFSKSLKEHKNAIKLYLRP